MTPRGLLGALRDDRITRMLALAAVALLFWVVRVRYWSTTFELR